MEITRKDIANYHLLGELIEKDKKKLERYKNNEPQCVAGKVYGSMQDFPYAERGFEVSGVNEAEYARWREWDKKCRYLELKIDSDMRRMNELEAAIDELIAGMDDVLDKAILEYTKEGKTQQWIARKVNLDQSAVSKRIGKYVKEREKE